METITFYSYKGGAGRSLLLVNVARFLTQEGKRTVAVDLDLEAPGLHYKFGLHDKDGGKLTSLANGVARYLSWLPQTPGSGPDIGSYVYDVPVKDSTGSGSLRLVPAGDAPGPGYPPDLIGAYHALFSNDWYNETDACSPLERLKNDLEHKLETPPEYLLIDARTGITLVGGIALHYLSDKVVVLMPHNDENLEGSRAMLRGLKESCMVLGKPMPSVVPVVSRLPYSPGDPRANDLVEKIMDYLCAVPRADEASVQLDYGDLGNAVVLHSQPSLQSHELILVGSKSTMREAVLLRDYISLFKRLLPKVLEDSAWRNLANIVPDEIDHPDWFAGESTDISVGTSISENVARRASNLETAGETELLVVPVRFVPEGDAFQRLGAYVVVEIQAALQSKLRKSRQQPGLILKPEPVGEGLVSYDLLGPQMRQGLFDFCEDGYFLTEERSLTVGVVQFGVLRDFTCCVRGKTALYDRLHNLSASAQDNETDFEQTIKVLSLERLRTDKVEIQTAVLGEAAATDATIRTLTKYTHVEVKRSAEDLWLWLREPNADPDSEKMVVCDHGVLQRIVQYETQAGQQGIIVAEGPQFKLLRDIPVGYLYPKGDDQWRREIAQALARAIYRNVWSEDWLRIANDLETISVRAFSFEEMQAYLALDMSPDEAIEWASDLKQRGLRPE